VVGTLASTANAGDTIIAVIFGEAASPPSLTGVSGGGLTWIKRYANNSTTGCADTCNLETWYATAPSALGSTAVTATFNATATYAGIIVFAVSGGTTSAPFDTNGSLPDFVTGSAGVTGSDSLSTTATKSLIFNVCGWDTGAAVALGHPGGGYTELVSGTVGARLRIDGQYAVASSAQTGQNAGFGGAEGGTGNWNCVADAMK